ncbi:MAG: HEPN domain-containing protein [Candidatus Scalindua sp.]|nr:HEPN domain-containing protein [Candidatus Scalindua sp.]
MSRYQDWLKQAANDLEWVKHSLEGEFFAQTCFISQLAGEKALKAFCFYKGFDIVKTHSLFQIVRSLKEDGKLEKNAKELDIFYISGRYPDAFPEGGTI